jgi:ArsR family transcriptional regulator, arsenate/arsenite/antimonite-responsive transcriptional repressor
MKKSNAIAALGALGQESRLDIFRVLIEKGPQGLPAGDIGERLGLPPPTLSFHLNQLRYAGLVSSRRESRSIIYTANYKTMNSLLTFLTENCCADRTEICAAGACDAAKTVEPTDRKATERPRGISGGFEDDNAKANS